LIVEILGKLSRYVARGGTILIAAALIAGMAGCGPARTIQIRNWYDLDAIRNALGASYSTRYVLMNDLDRATTGYEELASPTANDGKGWQPIGTWDDSGRTYFDGILLGQGYEIRDLFINRPDEDYVGLFGATYWGGPKDITVVDFTVAGGNYVGVLVGRNDGQINDCYCAVGSVTGNSSVGGLVGQNEKGSVNDSYFTGNVTGTERVGGLVGYNKGTVRTCYSIGAVTGSERVGGLVGSNAGNVSNSFWDIETSGQSTSGGGTGKTTNEMQDITTFSSAGWNIIAVTNPDTRNPSYVWNIVDGVTYPFLSWQPA
jgi:hypothetical protein